MPRPPKTTRGLYQRKGSRFWWLRWVDATGELQRESSGTESKTAAQAILERRREEARQGVRGVVSRSTTMAGLLACVPLQR